MHESSYDDWEILESNEVNHSSYCIDQVSLNERNHSQFITENGTPAEVQEERRKYSRFGHHHFKETSDLPIQEKLPIYVPIAFLKILFT